MALDLAWLIPALPLAAFALVALFGKWTPERGGWLTFLAIAASGVLSLLVGWDVWQHHREAFHVSDAFIWTLQDNLGHAWLEAGSLVFDMGVYVDNLTAFLLVPVGILTTGIALYSLGYMGPEKEGYHLDDGTHVHIDGRQRYYAALALFVAGMLGFVLGSNLLMMFIFWEIMGLCSYLLIGYWYAKPSASAAAQKAFLTTRVGDVFFLLGLAVLAVTFGDVTGQAFVLDLDVILAEENISAVASASPNTLGLALLCLFVGAVGKSAQFPLHIWLPDAMEGPTTVSALIHAATMVKAGVFLIARFMPLYAQVDWVLMTVAGIGALTALLAASMAVFNNDIKRVLAFSTISQLGYMFLGMGAVALVAGGFTAGLLHLLNHAFFKALLFLCAGAVGFAIHSYDMREFGGLKKYMPVTAWTMFIATLSISGVPPFSGFWSKDLLLEEVWLGFAEGGSMFFLALWVIALVTAGLTAYYMFRLWFMTFLGDYRGDHDEDHLHDGTWHMNAVLIVLAGISIVTGFAIFLPEGFVFLPEHPLHFSLGHLIGAWQTYAGLGVVAIGIAAAWAKWNPSAVEDSITADEDYQGYPKVAYRRYYLTEIYYAAVDKTVVAGAFLLDTFDRLVIDAAVDLVGKVNAAMGDWGRKLQTGLVSDYALAILSGVLLMVIVVVYILRYTVGGGL